MFVYNQSDRLHWHAPEYIKRQEIVSASDVYKKFITLVAVQFKQTHV